MSNIYKYNQNERATVCANKTCVTVYGDKARIANNIALATAAITLFALIVKVLR